MEFHLGSDRVPLICECRRLKSHQPVNDYVHPLPPDVDF